MAVHIRCLYGTETGTAWDVAERIGLRSLARGAARCDVLPIDAIRIHEWLAVGATVVHLFVVSTTGQGDTPASMRDTWQHLLDADCTRLEGMRFAVFGLGDSTYEYFNFAAKKLHNRLVQLGATPVVGRGLGDEQDANGFDEELEPWLETFWTAIGLPSSSAAPETDALFFRPKYTVVYPTPPPQQQHVSLVDEKELPPPMGGDWWVLSVESNRRLTSSDHFQTVHHVDMNRPNSLLFDPGDAFGVIPYPDTAALRWLLSAYGNPIIALRPNTATFAKQTNQTFFDAPPVTLERLLERFFDLQATARRCVFDALGVFATDPEDRERLRELAILVPEYDRYCWREKRTTVEVLTDFSPRIQLPLDVLLSVLPSMTPRWYSVSSPPSTESVVSLTVGLLVFKTPMGRVRYGTCSHQLVHATIGRTFLCTIRRSRHVEGLAPDAPLLLIGPGTGIAPCRSLALWAPSRAILFTGNRNRAHDFLYGEEFGAANIEHYAAFSREVPPHKWRYVQHALVANAARVAEQLRNAHTCIFVAGNAKRMPQDVEEALASIAASRLFGGDNEAGQQLIRAMKRDGRYVNDTWS